MKKKQIVGIIIAAAVFVAVGITWVASAAKARESVSSGLSLAGGATSEPLSDYLGIIDISGEISEGSYDYFGNPAGYVQSIVLDEIEQMKNSERNKGILLLINSPGGTVYHSDEVYLALMDYKSETGRPIYAYSTETMASGAYYIGCAADEIFANRNATVGSIGVYVQTMNFKGLYDKLGISGEYIRSGRNKAMGNQFDELTEEQRAIYQSIVDECYDQFVGIVCDSRGYTRDELVPIADGRVYTAAQAVSNGIIDGIDVYDNYLEKCLDALDVEVSYNPETTSSSFMSLLSGLANAVPKSETEAALKLAENSESGVPMYYAQ